MRPVEVVQTIGFVLWFLVMMMVAIRKRFLRTLERADAFDNQSAIELPTAKPWKRFVRDRLVGSGAIGETADGRYWLDRDRAAVLHRIRRRRGLTAVAIIFALGGLAFVLVQWAR